GTELTAAGRRQRRLQRVLIQDVHELIACCDRAIGQLFLGKRTYERVDALERVKPILHLGRRAPCSLRDDERIELRSLQTRDHAQPQTGGGNAPEPPTDEAPNRRRQLPFDFGQVTSEPPTLVALNHAATAEVSEQVDHEQWIPFCPGVYERRELGWKCMLTEF